MHDPRFESNLSWLLKQFFGLFLIIALLTSLLFLLESNMWATSDKPASQVVLTGRSVEITSFDPADAGLEQDLDILLESYFEETTESASSDIGVADALEEREILTRQTSGYCGCGPDCCSEFGYDHSSGCSFCEVLTE